MNTTSTPGIGPVTEDLVFAVTNRTGMPFGVVANVLFAAQAHQRDLADALAEALAATTVLPLPTEAAATAVPAGIGAGISAA